MRPFIKCAGGKRQLLPVLKKVIPKNFNCYFEPFLGGGALLLNIAPKKAIVGDLNSELINAWTVVRTQNQVLIQFLQILAIQYQNRVPENKKDFFYEQRKRYNELLKIESNHLSSNLLLEKAALFIFLNKTCFNGLYRVNRKGEFNVPWNQTLKPLLFPKTNLENIASFLAKQNITFLAKDFASILSKTKKKDFIYLDPPYDLLKKDSFIAYTGKPFASQEQDRLAQCFRQLDAKGCYVALSNNGTTKIKHLYRKYHIYPVSAKRMINCRGDKRGNITEVIITNYPCNF